jgi:hypothetical protein
LGSESSTLRSASSTLGSESSTLGSASSTCVVSSLDDGGMGHYALEQAMSPNGMGRHPTGLHTFL